MIRDFLRGIGLLLRGFGGWASSPGLMLLGMIPAAIVAALALAALVGWAFASEPVAVWITPFAADWDEGWRIALRVALRLALVAGLGLVLVLSFTALTLAVGDPFYERIWERTEERLGGRRPEPPGAWRSFARGLGNALRLIGLSIALGLGVFVVSLVPVVGPPVAAVGGVLVGGWLIALEATGFAFDARGHPLRERRARLASRRGLSLGFGVASYVCFLLPLGSVVAMPAVVVGATLLARTVLDEPGSAPAAQAR